VELARKRVNEDLALAFFVARDEVAEEGFSGLNWAAH